jgi:hypothetical protein
MGAFQHKSRGGLAGQYLSVFLGIPESAKPLCGRLLLGQKREVLKENE